MRLATLCPPSIARPVLALLAAVPFTTCVTTRGAPADLPPYTFTIPVPTDSAMRVLRVALEAEHVLVEPDAVAGARTLRGSFVVRQGGLGETEVFLTGRVSDDDDILPPAARIELEVSVRERRRPIVMAPADVRTGGTRPEMTTVNPNDKETIGVLVRIRDRLTSAGAVRAARGTPS